jgi:glycosyltransferase involved in cell wall biosynthesis
VLDERGYETRLVRGREGPKEGSMDPLAEQLAVRPLRLPTLRRSIGIGDLLSLTFLLRQIRSWRPEILHTHASKAGALGRLAALLARGCRPKVIVHTFHGHVLDGYFSPRVSALFIGIERVLARYTDCIIAVSKEVKHDLIEFGIAPPERIAVVRVGFDLSPFFVCDGDRQTRRAAVRHSLGIPTDAHVVTFVGRLAPIKRVDRFLRVAVRVTNRNVWFLVVGDGELRDALTGSPEAVSLGQRLRWAGLRRDMPDVYLASDVLAVTSDNEGTAVSAIEAQAAGLPVVTTRVGGMPTVVVDGETGFVVDREDEEAFATALDSLVRDGGLRERFGRAGTAHARDQFSLNRLVDEIDRLYHGLLQSTGRS